MSVNEALRILRERFGIVVICLLLAVLGAGVATSMTPRQYSSDVTLYVSLQGRAESSDAAYQASQLAKERVVSYGPLLTDERILQPVIDRLQLRLTTAQLASRIAVTVEPETVVLQAAVTDGSPERAAAIANALAEEFVGLVQQLEEPFGPAPPPPAPGRAPVPSTQIGAQIIRPATSSATPVSPNPPFNLAIGAALGLLVGVTAAFVRAARDTSVRSSKRLQELVSAPVLSEIAYDSGVPRAPMTIDERFGSPRAEAFRRLRTNLQFLDHSNRHKVIVVTSSVVGEGKTTTACNLALALAQAGHRVLLMDANLRRPQVSEYLGLDPGPGLTNILTQNVSWEYTRQRWNEGAFDVLPAGPVPAKPSDLLASWMMADLLYDLRQQYGFVIVDTPALWPVTDAAALAARADGAVLVVQHRKASEEQVAGARDALHAVSARLLGTVLTMTPRGRRGRGRVRSYPEPSSMRARPADQFTSAPQSARPSESPLPAGPNQPGRKPAVPRQLQQDGVHTAVDEDGAALQQPVANGSVPRSSGTPRP